jgi:hypothetical protein
LTRRNLWPLCEECLEGKHQYLETYASYSEQRRKASKSKRRDSADSDGAQ